MRRLAPEIFRKRLLVEGYFTREQVDDRTIREYFTAITGALGLRTYGEPIVHHTGGRGKAHNQGYDAFVPLIDSGIYLCIWSGPRFASAILYTCAEFDEAEATDAVLRAHGMGDGDVLRHDGGRRRAAAHSNRSARSGAPPASAAWRGPRPPGYLAACPTSPGITPRPAPGARRNHPGPLGRPRNAPAPSAAVAG